MDVVLLILIAYLPVVYVSIIVHELGHVLLAKAAGLVVGSAGAGGADPFWVGTWRGTRLFLCRRRPLEGVTFVLPDGLDFKPWQFIVYTLGGILANALTAGLALLLLLWVDFASWLWGLLAAVNGYLAFANLMPFQFRRGGVSFQSDGAQILGALRGQPRFVPPGLRVRRTRGLRNLLTSVGDFLTLRQFLLSSAEAWLELGNLDAADEDLAESVALPVPATESSRAIEAIVRAQVCLTRNQHEEAQTWLDQVEETWKQLGARGVQIVALLRSFGWIGAGELDRARTTLQECADLGAHVDVQALALQLRGHLDQARPEPGRLEQITADYEASRRAQPGSVLSLAMPMLLATGYARQENWTKASVYYHEALWFCRASMEQLAEEKDQKRFAAGQAELRTQARECFLRLKLEEADRLEEVYFTPPVARTPVSTPTGLMAVVRLLGVVVHAVNFALVVMTIVLGAAVRFQTWNEGWDYLWREGPWGLLLAILADFKAWKPVVGVMILCLGAAGALAAIYAREPENPSALRRLWPVSLLILGLTPWLVLTYVVLNARGMLD